MRKILLLLFISCIFTWQQANAQSSCTQTLRTARSTYDQGRLHELPALLEGCIRNGFSQQEKVEAYKLLTLAYIYLEEPAKADEAMLNLLRTDHYFEINPATDPAEFIGLYKTFRTTPIYRFGGKAGGNATQPNVMESVEANDGISKYSYGIGFQFYLTAEIPLGKNLVLNPEIGFTQRAINYKNTVSFTDTTFITTAKEKQGWLTLPVSIQYQFNRYKLKPYIALGVQGDYLLSSSLAGSRVRSGYQFIEEKSFDLSTQREKFNVSAIASVGARLALGGGYMVVEARYMQGLTNVNSKTTAYNVDSNLAFQYGYADSVFKLNALSVSAGFVYNIFNPKKLRHRK